MRFILSLFLAFLILTPAALAKDDKVVIPDSYTCTPDHCNRCDFSVIGFPPVTMSVFDGKCTEAGCSGSTPDIDALYQKCSKDWRYSKNLQFDEFSYAENACVNGLRNLNYWDQSFNKKSFGRSAAFAKCLEHHHKSSEQRYSKRVSDLCQDGWKDFSISKEAIFKQHAERSAAFAYRSCDGYFEKLETEFGLSKNELNVLAEYIESRRFPALGKHRKQSMVRGDKIEDVEILKHIFTLLAQKKWVNTALVVTPEMVEQFERDYAAMEKP